MKAIIIITVVYVTYVGISLALKAAELIPHLTTMPQ